MTKEIVAAAVGRTVARVSRALQEVLGVGKVYLFVLGHRIPHLHVHLVPLHPETPAAYRGMRIAEWPDAPRDDEAAIAALAGRVREALA